MVKVFYRRFRPLSSLDEGGGRAVGHALAVCLCLSAAGVTFPGVGRMAVRCAIAC